RWEKWKEISADHWKHLIPTLVRPFMHWCQETSYGRHEGSQRIIPLNCKCGKSARRVEVTAVYTDRLEHHSLMYCECCPLALTLVAMGLFPASPIRPSIAFSLSHLLFASKLFVYISPNITAWCSTISSNLIEKGFTPSATVSKLITPGALI
ncbi:hypothetical protein BS47DRAFT_1295493, partial [Hydnum rufescens UP504]